MSQFPNIYSEHETYDEGNKKFAMELEFIRTMLAQENVQNYEPDVLTHLADFTNNYILQIIENALVFMNLMDRKNILISDVKLALEVMHKQAESSKRLSFQDLMALSKVHNRSKVFYNREFYGLPIPADSINKNNYKMRNIHNLKYGTSVSPMVDITNMQTQISSLDTKKQIKLQGHVSSTTNIPPKIVIKPQFQTPNTVYLKQMKMEIDP
ncbi:uncharacterized protein LOC108735788 isoform X1 [Agrilus planipennis]|uniref:Uncharacterized protein LOC108735788 isoform X1 n=1 Tax=Agrilus planipennis TaxID=224129 RepID=A0A1W4WHM3_AGRPL|nr:uncharacterized protein LOC108735788 isoform X1 [Agrilus planipennis]